jgi:hypothetical protein
MRNLWVMTFAGVVLLAAPGVGAAKAQQGPVKNGAADGSSAQRPGGAPRASDGSAQTGTGQNGIPRVPTMPPIDGAPPDDGPDPMAAHQRASRARAFAEDRQKHIVDETAKLLQLATELKTDVDKSNKNELSLNVVKKAEDIEKLAHDVKQRMRS